MLTIDIGPNSKWAFIVPDVAREFHTPWIATDADFLSCYWAAIQHYSNVITGIAQRRLQSLVM